MNPNTNSDFKKRYGPWAVVTGASSGIGRAIAVELAARGLAVVVAARNRDELERLSAELKQAGGADGRVIAVDLASPDGVRTIEEATRDLDVGLFVAAAGFGTAGAFLESKETDELSMLDVNCRAVLLLSRHFGRRLVKRGRDGMVLFGSLVGFQGAPRAAHYAATKAYVQNLAEALHVELAPQGVDVLSAAPGPVKTGFGARARMRMGAADNAEAVARATLGALGRKMTVAPGPISKLLTFALMTAPRGLRVRIMGKIMGGMTAHIG
jgi:short-subunit dehydrogenase